MILHNPTYEDLEPYVGRHVTVDGEEGCMVAAVFNHSLAVYVALITGDDHGYRISHCADCPKFSHVGPINMIATWHGKPTKVVVHEPIKNFSPLKPKLWWLAVPLLLKAVYK